MLRRRRDNRARSQREKGQPKASVSRTATTHRLGCTVFSSRCCVKHQTLINDDKIAAGRGFPTHPHRDMEIIAYVLEGALQHKDSTGKGAIIRPDDIQMMSAGTGITHSEYNPSEDTANHFLQIWIEPGLRGVRPRYSENQVTVDDKINQWRLIAGPDGSDAAVGICQDAKMPRSTRPSCWPANRLTIRSSAIGMAGYKSLPAKSRSTNHESRASHITTKFISRSSGTPRVNFSRSIFQRLRFLCRKSTHEARHTKLCMHHHLLRRANCFRR